MFVKVMGRNSKNSKTPRWELTSRCPHITKCDLPIETALRKIVYPEVSEVWFSPLTTLSRTVIVPLTPLPPSAPSYIPWSMI